MASSSHVPAPQPIDDLEGWLSALTQPTVLLELLSLAVCVGLAWGLVRLLRRALGQQDERSIWFGRREVDGVLFPLVLLCLGYGARALLDRYIAIAAFRVAIPVLVSDRKSVV